MLRIKVASAEAWMPSLLLTSVLLLFGVDVRGKCADSAEAPSVSDLAGQLQTYYTKLGDALSISEMYTLARQDVTQPPEATESKISASITKRQPNLTRIVIANF